MSAYLITRDGKPVDMPGTRYEDENAAFGALLRKQGMSTDWAIKHEGWNIVPVPDEVYDEVLEVRRIRAHAQRMFTDHGHNWSDRDPMTRENCQACCLGGYRPNGGEHDVLWLGPNVSNWERDYVQAGRTLWATWIGAFIFEVNTTDNTRWRDALMRDLRTFGMYVKVDRTRSSEVVHLSYDDLAPVFTF